MSGSENIIPTRLELQNLKAKKLAAVRGHDLLKKKSDALTLRFRSLLREIRETKLRVGELSKDALFAYTEVKFVANDISPQVIQSVNSLTRMVSMRLDNIAGVRVPNFDLNQQEDQDRNDPKNYIGLSRGGQQINKARESFTELLDQLIKLAMLQSTFQIIDQVLRVTNRRVNAMEYVLIPKYTDTIALVDFGLEETEREEMYRMKKVQGRRKEIEAENERQRIARLNGGKEEKEDIKTALDDSSDDDELLF